MDNIEELLEDSRRSHGALGALVFAVEKAFRWGGATQNQIQAYQDLCQESFSKLSNDQCNLLCELIEKRFKQDKDANGQYYS